jgi:hypothetical protein
MIVRVVGLVCEKRKLASASFTEIQYWTESSEEYLVDLNVANEADLLDLRFLLEGLWVGKISEFLEQRKLGLQCKVESGPEQKRDCFTQNFQNTKKDFYIKLIYRNHMTSPNFCGILKGIFKKVVVQQRHFKIWKCY